MQERRKNPKWKLLDRARTRLYSAIKKKQGIKSKKTLELLGVKDFLNSNDLSGKKFS